MAVVAILVATLGGCGGGRGRRKGASVLYSLSVPHCGDVNGGDALQAVLFEVDGEGAAHGQGKRAADRLTYHGSVLVEPTTRL